MLKTRLLTIGILLIFLFGLLWWGNHSAILSVLGILCLVAIDEWGRLTQQTLFSKAFGCLCFVLSVVVALLYSGGWVFVFLGVTTIMWGFWALRLHCARKNLNLMPIMPPKLHFLMGVYMLAVLNISLSVALNQSLFLFVYVLSIVWVMDSAAYAVGRTLGKSKLAPAISPGKSIEGAVGALGVMAVYSAMVYTWLDLSISWFVFVLISIFAGVISIYGDLYLSALKRVAGVKDTGNILPGHGGLLDRIDSLLAAAPTFVFCLFLLQVTP